MNAPDRTAEDSLAISRHDDVAISRHDDVASSRHDDLATHVGGTNVRYPAKPFIGGRRFTLKTVLWTLALTALFFAYVHASWQTRMLQSELSDYRSRYGYLAPSGPREIAVVRCPSDRANTWKYRVRVPDAEAGYRLAYSTGWASSTAHPQWYGAVPVPAGQWDVTLRVAPDERDNRWKISVVIDNGDRTMRIGTVLPQHHVDRFRRSHPKVRGGVGSETAVIDAGAKLRFLDHRILAGEGALQLFGDSAPRGDLVGVFAELQPDLGTL